MARRKNDEFGVGVADGNTIADGVDGAAGQITGDDGGYGGIDGPISIAGIPVTNPAAIKPTASNTTGGGEKRGRGRPPGGGATKQKTAAVSIAGIEKILYSLHMMAAKFTGIGELEIDNAEAKILSDAIANVASHYNTTVDPKIMAWVGLVGVAGAVYGPRFAAYRIRSSIR